MEIPASLLGRLSYLLGSLYRRSLDLEAAALDRLGIGVKHQAALGVLADEGAMTQQQLGHRLGIDRTTIVGVIDALAERGMIERVRDPADRRAYLLTLTAVGRGARADGERLVRAVEGELLAGLDEGQREVLAGLLARAVRGGAGTGS